jgi:hypothetical protein
VAERFARAVGQLGAPAGDVRVGALFALERIGEDSGRDTQPVLLTVATYIKDRLPHDKDRNRRAARFTPSRPQLVAQGSCRGWRQHRRSILPADDAVALHDVLPSLEQTWQEEQPSHPSRGLQFADFHMMNLGRLDLRGLWLDSPDFTDANVSQSQFQGVLFDGKVLFRDACAFGVDFSASSNQFSGYLDFRGANLAYARFSHSGDVSHARFDFRDADLEHARIPRVLPKVDLRGADLRNAQVPRGFFKDATIDSRTDKHVIFG